MQQLNDLYVSGLEISQVYPLFCVLAGALVVLLVSAFYPRPKMWLCGALSVAFLAADLYFVLSNTGAIYAPKQSFFGLVFVSGVAYLAQILILLSSVFFILLSLTQNSTKEFQRGEYYAIWLFVIAGLQCMVSSTNIVVILLGLEISSLGIYGLIALSGGKNSTEAAIKYFTMGAYASAFFVFGAAFLYLGIGSLDLLVLKSYSIHTTIGFVLMFCGLGVKLSAVPFHTWTPDAYEGSNAIMAGFMSIAPKIAAFVVAFYLFNLTSKPAIELSDQSRFPEVLLFIIVVLTMSVPNLLALVQKDVKRMLGYSSISHAGFLLSGVLIGGLEGLSSLFAYWVWFMFANIGAFGMLWLLRDSKDTQDYAISRFSGLAHRSLISAVSLGIFMFALAGIPPLSVFWGKFILIKLSIDSGYSALAIIMAINSAIAAFYYLRVVVASFLHDSTQHTLSPQKSVFGVAIVAICVFYVSLCVLMAQNLLDSIQWCVLLYQ